MTLQLLGLTATQIGALLAALGALVTALYFLKQQRQRLTVPFAPLWQELLAETATTRLFARLRRWLSLLLALAILGLMCLALGDPQQGAARSGARTLVVLLDSGLTMQATDAAPSRLAAAKSRVAQLIDGMGPADRMLLARLDTSALPLTPLTDDARLLHEALREVEPSDLATDLRPGLRLARDVLEGEPGGELVLVSDGHHAPLPQAVAQAWPPSLRLSHIRVGGERHDLAVTAFAMRRYPLDRDRGEVLVELRHDGSETVRAELTLLGDGEPIDVREVELPAGGPVRHVYGDISGVRHTLEAKLAPLDGAADALPATNHAYARVPAKSRVRVLCVTEGNRYLEAALLLDEYLDVDVIDPAGYAQADVEGYDVLIFDRALPPGWPARPAIYLAPPAGAEGDGVALWATRGHIERPSFDRLREDDPLLRWTVLRDVNVARAQEVTPAPQDEVVAADPRGPLIVRGQRGTHRFVALTFDVRASDLPLRVAWPLLLLNGIDGFTRQEADDISSYRTGEPWHLPVAAHVAQAEIHGPADGTWRVPVVDGRLQFSARRAGLYRIQAGDQRDVVAVNVPPLHSAQAPADPPRLGTRRFGEPSHGQAGVARALWPYLAAVALVLLTAEWLTYQRRWTV